jgi:hypothetical protein
MDTEELGPASRSLQASRWGTLEGKARPQGSRQVNRDVPYYAAQRAT